MLEVTDGAALTSLIQHAKWASHGWCSDRLSRESGGIVLPRRAVVAPRRRLRATCPRATKTKPLTACQQINAAMSADAAVNVALSLPVGTNLAGHEPSISSLRNARTPQNPSRRGLVYSVLEQIARVVVILFSRRDKASRRQEPKEDRVSGTVGIAAGGERWSAMATWKGRCRHL